jgi:hypothetical protein
MIKKRGTKYIGIKLPRILVTGIFFNALKSVVIANINRIIPINFACMILFELKVSL